MMTTTTTKEVISPKSERIATELKGWDPNKTNPSLQSKMAIEQDEIQSCGYALLGQAVREHLYSHAGGLLNSASYLLKNANSRLFFYLKKKELLLRLRMQGQTPDMRL